MSIPRQIGLTLFVLICTMVLAVVFLPAAPSTLLQLGVPASLISLGTGNESQSGRAPSRLGAGAQGRGGGAGQVALVVAKPAASGTINDRLEAVGSGESLKSVSVVPLTEGVLTEVAVTSGSRVKVGDVLARLNSQTEEIARDQAAVAFKVAEDKLGRYQALLKTNVATKVELSDSQAEYDAARLALREAEVNLDLRSVLAPIDGVVGIVPSEVGDYVTNQTEIAMIDDRSTIIVNFWVPERFAGSVRIGQAIDGTSFAFANEVFAGEINAIGSRVESESRTLQVQARIANDQDRLRPGMSFAISMRFDGEHFLAVDPLAVQWDSAGSFVWQISDGLAKHTPVRIVQRNPETILIDGDLDEGTDVVVQGLLALRDGAAVRMSGPSPAAPREADPQPSEEPTAGAQANGRRETPAG